MKKTLILIILGLVTILSACQNQKKDSQESSKNLKSENQFNLPDSLSSRRIAFVLNLKQKVAEKAWPGFGEKNTEGTLIYFNGNNSEVFFPNALVIKTLDEYTQYGENYLLTSRTDSIPYHMENMLSFDESDASRFFYDSPVEQYSSVEEIGNYIPSVESTEMWSTMVIHEMFHHYQLNNKNYKTYAKSPISGLALNPNTLISLFKEDQNFLPMIQSENEYLMQALSEEDTIVRDELISKYLNARESRIQLYSEAYPDLEQVENFYVIQEGSARYIEYESMLILSDYANNSNSTVIANDPMFKSYSEFKEVNLSDKAFDYLTYASPSTYYYAIGFNMMRLLDELKVEYKSKLLNNPDIGLHNYLEDYINALTD
ncbi:hypothetical protein V8G56_08690 [Gaetbulibacter aquiaggeris]|uniref:Aminopeptidase n=1 Tax=Gaetbulibacter aquiaggeris TaxID=1735373 RepID=A0ABW7MQE0_9FLAO